jgi:hypothetical protein
VIRRLLIAFALVFGLIGPASAIAAASPVPAAAGPTVSAPITSGIVQGNDTWLVVPMGHLPHFLNTFWQLFVRTPTDNGWVTVTPPGVADNGGLVIAAGPGGSLLAGFLPNQDLTFSPLSLTDDGGRTWTGVYFPQGLIAVPDALGFTDAGITLGLGSSKSGSVLESPADLSSWRTATTAAPLGHTAAGGRCGIVRLTAAAIAPSGDPLVGTACRNRGVIGLFDITGGGARAVAFPTSPTLAGATVSVLRLVPTATGVSVLLAAHERTGRTTLVAGWLSGSGPAARLSASLAVPIGAKLLASGTTPGGGVFVLVQPPGGGAPELADVAGSGVGRAAWDVLTPPPRGTLGAAFSPGRIDAVTVHSSTLIDYAFDESTATWVRSQVIDVPIQYGSSS